MNLIISNKAALASRNSNGLAALRIAQKRQIGAGPLAGTSAEEPDRGSQKRWRTGAVCDYYKYGIFKDAIAETALSDDVRSCE
jgi:hypothetical protein